MPQAKIIRIAYGAKIVSLISAVKIHGGVSLVEAKSLVERAIDGEPVTIELKDAPSLAKFQEIATKLGAVVVGK